MGLKIVELYKDAIKKLCVEGEQSDRYGEVTKIDVDNCLSMHDRILIGYLVVQSKLESDKNKNKNITLMSTVDMRDMVVDKEREEKVLQKVMEVAARYELNPEIARELFRGMIDLTVELEIDYLKDIREELQANIHSPMGFGQVPFKKKSSRIGWGNGN